MIQDNIECKGEVLKTNLQEITESFERGVNNKWNQQQECKANNHSKRKNAVEYET